MSLPALLFGVLLSTLYGAAFHLWRGGSAGRFIFDLLLAWVGFWIGHMLASRFGWTFFSVGALHVGMATLVSAIFLISGHWLSLIEVQRK